MNFWDDHTFKCYMLMVVASAYDLILFTAWGVYIWKKERLKMSTVFWAIDGLFLAILCAFSLNLHVRHVRFKDVDHYVEMMGSDIWAFRHMPLVAILAGIGFFMTRRWYHTCKFKQPINRMVNGRRESDIKDL